MAGYATMMRVQGGPVRALAFDGAPGRVAQRSTDAPADVGLERPARPRPTVRERWDGLREELGMMTFYLFDPESWR